MKIIVKSLKIIPKIKQKLKTTKAPPLAAPRPPPWPNFDYFGKKFDEQVMRRLYFTEAAKITFILTGDIDSGAVTANIEPEIDGRKLVFKVPQDEALILEDNKSTASEMQSNFIPVDQIIIERL